MWLETEGLLLLFRSALSAGGRVVKWERWEGSEVARWERWKSGVVGKVGGSWFYSRVEDAGEFKISSFCL